MWGCPLKYSFHIGVTTITSQSGVQSIGTNVHNKIAGEAFTAVAFMRNAVSIGIPFAITPWMKRNGIQTMFITCGMVSFAIAGLVIPMALWGKSARRKLKRRYEEIVEEHGHAGPQ